MDRRLYAIDFGAGDALAIHGPTGEVKKKDLAIPRQKGGKTTAQEFILVAEALMRGAGDIAAGDVVVESATIGASGCETNDVIALLARMPGKHLYTISCRAVKNYRKDHELEWRKGARYAKDGAPPPVTLTLEEQAEVHRQDAAIIYEIATRYQGRLYDWRGPSASIERENTSVRPMDKRGYRDDRAEELMTKLPPYNSLPPELREVVGNGRAYCRAVVMPFVLSADEPYVDDGPREERRKRWQKVIGLYDRGYPSFYRRATITFMQRVAKRLAGVSRMEEVDQPTRKEAWKITQRQLRQFFYLMLLHQGRY